MNNKRKCLNKEMERKGKKSINTLTVKYREGKISIRRVRLRLQFLQNKL